MCADSVYPFVSFNNKQINSFIHSFVYAGRETEIVASHYRSQNRSCKCQLEAVSVGGGVSGRGESGKKISGKEESFLLDSRSLHSGGKI